MKQNYFDGIIGQQRVLKTLSFYLDGYKASGVLLPTALFGSKGLGKTTLARTIGKNLLNSDNKPKRFLEINGASLKNLRRFVESVVIPFVQGGQETTIFLDEVHSVDESVLDWLLSVLCVDNDKFLTHATFDGQNFDFDFTRVSFILASTNQEKLSSPFRDRLKRVDLESYTASELLTILEKKLNEVKLADAGEEIISTCRGNPRKVVDISKDIKSFCGQRKTHTFNYDDWKKLKNILNIRPLGITGNEYQLLKYLDKHGAQSLRCLAAALNLDSSTVQREIELYLIAHGLISIDIKRKITDYGQKVLKECT